MHDPRQCDEQNEEAMSQARCVFSWVASIKTGHRCEMHTHACTEIVYSGGTAGTLYQGSRQFVYGDRSTFVYQPGSTHWVENRHDGEHICVGIVGCGAASLPEGVWDSNAPLVNRFAEIRQVIQTADPLQTTRLDFLAGLLVCDLLSLQPNWVVAPLSRAGRVREHIENSLTTPLCLEELAGSVSVSKEYLRQLFREEFGESITQYIIRRRIDLAAQLLHTTHDPIREIAAQTGFANEYYFSRLFRKVREMSPSEWRAKLAVSRD